VGKIIKERIILGLDPGTNVMGYGVIMVRKPKIDLLQFGVIQLNKYESHELRLKKIFERVLRLIDDFILMRWRWKHLSLEKMFNLCSSWAELRVSRCPQRFRAKFQL
jgi:Holliday junction resolvasome RuvABC endonuclease subunit